MTFTFEILKDYEQPITKMEMNTKDFFSEIEECLLSSDVDQLKEILSQLVSKGSDIENAKLLSEYILKNYTHYKSDYYAVLLENIIKVNPNLALVNYPENDLFKLCVITGSYKLFECFVEEAIEPYLTDNKEDDWDNYSSPLYTETRDLSDSLFKNYKPFKKGMDFNGAIGPQEGGEDLLLINRDNYNAIEGVMENYNSLIGRRDILKWLGSKFGLNE